MSEVHCHYCGAVATFGAEPDGSGRLALCRKHWRENRDAAERGLWEIDRKVLDFIRDHSDLPLLDITRGVSDDMTAHTARARVKTLVRRGFVRQREDSVDHDWTYRARQ